MFINNRTKLLIKLSQLVLPSCLASKPDFFQGILGPINIFYSTPVFLKIFSATVSVERRLLSQRLSANKGNTVLTANIAGYPE